MATMHDEHATRSLPPHAPILDDGEILEGVNVPNPRLILQITLGRDEVHLLAEPARAANMPMGRYIKKMALEAAQRYQDEHPPREE